MNNNDPRSPFVTASNLASLLNQIVSSEQYLSTHPITVQTTAPGPRQAPALRLAPHPSSTQTTLDSSSDQNPAQIQAVTRKRSKKRSKKKNRGSTPFKYITIPDQQQGPAKGGVSSTESSDQGPVQSRNIKEIQPIPILPKKRIQPTLVGPLSNPSGSPSVTTSKVPPQTGYSTGKNLLYQFTPSHQRHGITA